MKRRFLALVLAGCLAAVLSTAAWATSPTGFYLNVELPSGETIALDVESGDSIDNVKQKVQNAAGVSVTEQYLYYGGKFLNNGRTLADYNIQKESTLLVASEAKGTPSGTPLTAAEPSKEWVNITEEKVLTEGTYFLCNNVNLTHPLVIRGNVTLDLNGFVLKITGSGSVIKIESGSLTLVDSHPAAIHKFVKNTDDPWMLDESQGAGIVRGGIITGGNAGYNDGGGVYVCPGAGLVMRGGSIVGCKAKQGGGVYVADKNEAKTLGRFTMEGGSIVGCVATDESYSGGGVSNHGDFTMTGGTIRSCTATAGHGGGICSVRQMSISGSAVVTDCKAGGSYVSSDAMLISPDSTYTAIIAGGTFDGNVVNNKSTTITGGTFNGQVRNSGVIENGQFNGAVNNYEGTIKGGTFNGSVKNESDYDDGVLRRAGTISGGTFNGDVQNKNSIISGGTFLGGVRGAWTVTFDTDGGSAVAKQIRANAPATKPSEPTKDGYDFGGWYTDEAFTTEYTFTESEKVTQALTLYAKWTKEAAKYYYYSPADGSADAAKGSPKTFDAGVGVYVGMAVLSVCGSTVVLGKKRK